MTSSNLPSSSLKFLLLTRNIWFSIVVVGQFIFALYIIGLYGVSGLAGDFERWNDASLHGYVEKDLVGNISFGIHLLLAAIITIGGPLQLIKSIRDRFPKFHRINGRIYIFSAFTISLAGFYLVLFRGIIGGIIGSTFISINGIIILICAFFTIKKAVQSKFKIHRKWALRLFLAMSGVWFFRVFLMLWLSINQGPVGLDLESFQGPALNVLYTISYIIPLFALELYFFAKKNKSKLYNWGLSIFVLLLSCGILIGTITATMGMWLPNI